MPLVSVFIMDPPELLDPPTDTTLAIMRESGLRGHRVYYGTLAGLRLENGRARLRLHPVSFAPGAELFTAGEETDLPPEAVDILYMRKDPPVDSSYLHATYILDHLPERILQINPPASLRNQCEKLIPLHIAGLMPETVVSCHPPELEAFLARRGKVVIKPLEDCSGRGIFVLRAEDPDRLSRLERATADGGRYLQAQRFLEEAGEGDKRVLLLGGEILGWVRRVPAKGDFRSNVNAGGRCVPCELTESDREICARLGAWLQKEGIHLAGVDIIGSHVLEVNITSPSCLREINALTGQSLEKRIVDFAEARVKPRNRS